LASAFVKPGDHLELRRDYDLVYDRNAVACFWQGVELALLDNEIGQYLAPLLDTGLRCTAEVIEAEATPRDTRLRVVIQERQRQF
jgi:hypothetical protein